jgi:N-acetylmuramoyl-L-alanine amidase
MKGTKLLYINFSTAFLSLLLLIKNTLLDAGHGGNDLGAKYGIY